MNYSNILSKLPCGLRIQRLIRTITAELVFPQCSEPGHYYSPIPSRKDLQADRKRIFERGITPPEVELNETQQMDLLNELVGLGKQVSLEQSPNSSNRYYIDNAFFNYADAIVLATLMLRFSPKQYIEIGSGFSSALALDIREKYNLDETFFTFIEPFGERLRSLLRPTDIERATILEMRVQDVSDDVFSKLQRNDFLFVDSSHLAKVGSDLNDILFRVLPLLKPGTIIHFHDIFWPFEYPENWVMKGRSWNEAYLLHAFLSNNNKYKVLLFSDYLVSKNPEIWTQLVSRAHSIEPSSLWLQKM